MEYLAYYSSPLGEMYFTSDDIGLTSVCFFGQRYAYNKDSLEERDTEIFRDTKRWMDIYFSGFDPGFTPPLHLSGSSFQKDVWDILMGIPYAETMTYGEIADVIASKRGLKRMSAQAVGGAVGHNPVSIIVPCHRVVGSNGSLTGYGGGIERKAELLKLEGVDISRFFIPRSGTAL